MPLPQHAEVTWVEMVLLLKQAPPEPALAVRLTRKVLGNALRPDLVHVTVTFAGEVTVVYGRRVGGRQAGTKRGRKTESRSRCDDGFSKAVRGRGKRKTLKSQSLYLPSPPELRSRVHTMPATLEDVLTRTSPPIELDTRYTSVLFLLLWHTVEETGPAAAAVGLALTMTVADVLVVLAPHPSMAVMLTLKLPRGQEALAVPLRLQVTVTVLFGATANGGSSSSSRG